MLAEVVIYLLFLTFQCVVLKAYFLCVISAKEERKKERKTYKQEKGLQAFLRGKMTPKR